MSPHPKRPRDPNQWAKRITDIVSGEVKDREPTPEDQGKDPAAVALGRKGGKARALHFLYYNFVRVHKTLRTTPAMAAGITKRLWEMSDVVDVLETWEVAAE
jgi:hypothetical protein